MKQLGISPPQNSRLYPSVVVAILLVWLIAMVWLQSWGWLREHWMIGVTMAFGSFIGSATPLGGGAVAFPVFTKVLGVNSADSRTFALFIQAVGMGAASILIISRRIPILWRVIRLVTLGGLIGIVVGSLAPPVPAPFPKLLFTMLASAFVVAMLIARWFSPCPPQNCCVQWGARQQALFFGIGIVGGVLSATLGAGINLITFIALTLGFGIDEKIGTPTTVVIMALNAALGAFLHAIVVQDVGVVYEYWMVAIPIAIFGAPLGAYAASRVKRETILIGLTLLVLIELLTTLWLIPLTAARISFCLLMLGACALLFSALLRYRQHTIQGERVVL